VPQRRGESHVHGDHGEQAEPAGGEHALRDTKRCIVQAA